MREIPIAELGQYSRWVEKLKNFERGPRTEADTFREYDTEKYQKLLRDAQTIDEALSIFTEEMCFSRHGKLYVDSGANVRALYEKLFVESLNLSGINIVIELGGGWGYHSQLLAQAYPDKNFIVGEFSPNARMLGERLTKNITFVPFNFYSDWNILDTARGAAVFSVHAVEMLEDAGVFIDEIGKRKDTLSSVTLFEPLYEAGNDELTTLRRKYIEANQYNKNLISYLGTAKIEHDYFGTNPLFPMAHIQLAL